MAELRPAVETEFFHIGRRIVREMKTINNNMKLINIDDFWNELDAAKIYLLKKMT